MPVPDATQKERPTAQGRRAVFVSGRIRITGPDAAGDERHIPAPLHHRAAVGVVACAGVALDGEDRAAHHADYNAYVLRFLPLSAEIEEHNVPRLVAVGHDLAGGKGLVPVHERRAAGRFVETESSLPEYPPDKGHAPGIRSAADLPAIISSVVLDLVGIGGHFHHAQLPFRDLKHGGPGLCLQGGHYSASTRAAPCTRKILPAIMHRAYISPQSQFTSWPSWTWTLSREPVPVSSRP